MFKDLKAFARKIIHINVHYWKASILIFRVYYLEIHTELRENENIILKKSEKGRGWVTMDKEYYINHIVLNSHLNILNCKPIPSNRLCFLQGWNLPFCEGTLPFWVPPSFWSKFKNYPPFSESYSNWCIQILWNTLKWRSYISYFTKSIENIITITLYTSMLNSVFTTDYLVRY